MLSVPKKRVRRGGRLASKEKERLFGEYDRWGWDAKGYSKKTRRNYGYRVRAADAWLEEHQGCSLVWVKAKSLKMYLFATTPNASNRNHIRQALVSFFVFLNDREVRPDNPAKDLPVLPQPKGIPKALEASLAERIVQAARAVGPMAQCLVTVFAFTGLRRDEARTLKWPQIDLDAGWLDVVGKGSKPRRIPIHEEVRKALSKWRTQSGDPEWVFPSVRHSGRPISENYLRGLILQVGRMAGMEKNLHPHALRHTFATQLLSQGSNIRTVQETLGHANIQTTALYLRVRPQQMKDDVRGLDYKEGRK